MNLEIILPIQLFGLLLQIIILHEGLQKIMLLVYYLLEERGGLDYACQNMGVAVHKTNLTGKLQQIVKYVQHPLLIESWLFITKGDIIG